MSYNNLKNHNGQSYTGMPIGAKHEWDYHDAVWEETKSSPDQWKIKFTSAKKRREPAPQGSGAAIGTRYHWFIIAHQRVTKKDKDTYDTEMEGLKFKIGHKRPYWRDWSYNYPGQASHRQKLIQILRKTLQQLEAEETASLSNSKTCIEAKKG